MEIRKTDYMVRQTGRPRIDGINHQVWYGPKDCDGHATTFTYDYTGEETANKVPGTHSTQVESWKLKVGTPLVTCAIINATGNHLVYSCQLTDASTHPSCRLGAIEHFDGAGFRLTLYATMKPKEATPRSSTPGQASSFVKSSKSMVYHIPRCIYAQKIQEPVKVTEVRSLTPCKACKPGV
jgi:hypothetical protein